MINLEGDLIIAWNNAGGCAWELERNIIQFIQEEMIELLRPSKKQLIYWKASQDGRSKFNKYITNKLGFVPPYENVQVLWRYYMGQTIKKRNQSLVNKFRKENFPQCSHCKETKGKLCVDHIIPLCKGGEDSIFNFQFLCECCHKKKGTLLDRSINFFIK
ncbi:HNH endonuclease [Bacillus cereus]|nr:HNH endonuclease [Bacillus cereus]